MHDFDYYKEVSKLTGFAQRCIEDYPKKDESFRRMQLELKARREFRKNLETTKLLQSNRYDLVDDCVTEEYLTDYSKLAGIFEKVDPDNFRIEYNSPKVISRKKNPKNLSSASKRSRLLENKKELLRGAEQNTSLVRTLLGGIQYIDLTHPSSLGPPLQSPAPPPPPPPPPPLSVPPLSAPLPPISIYDSQSRASLGNGLSLSHHTYPPMNSTAYSFPAFQQQQISLTPQQQMPPAPHMTSTLSPPRELRRERTVNQVSKSRKLSRKLPKKKVPKSLRRIGNIVEKYDLNM